MIATLRFPPRHMIAPEPEPSPLEEVLESFERETERMKGRHGVKIGRVMREELAKRARAELAVLKLKK